MLREICDFVQDNSAFHVVACRYHFQETESEEGTQQTWLIMTRIKV